jgi:hexosaminidase
LAEIIDLFPTQYIHVGGDEATKELWKDCPRCQQRIKDEGLQNENELQSWFMKRIESYLNAHGKKLLGWEEICEGGLNKTATIIHWRSREAGIPMLAAKQGNKIIMSPDLHCYFDYPYDGLPTAKVYSFNPVPEDLRKDYRESFLGVQACFWSHIARTIPDMDRQLFPRLIALSEVAWTEVPNKNWDSFNFRLNYHYKALDIMNIYYYTNNK